MTMIAYAFLQHRRLAAASGGKKIRPRPASADAAIRKSVIIALARAPPYRCPLAGGEPGRLQ